MSEPETPYFTSATQIETFSACERKWGWRYVAGAKAAPHKSAALGSEVHDTQLAPYLRDGTPLDFSRPSGYIAAEGLIYLPQPRAHGLRVEERFSFLSPTVPGIAYQGFKDLEADDSAIVPGFAVLCTDHEDCRADPMLAAECKAPGRVRMPFVGDHKTTSDLKWAKTESVLADDVQAVIYAVDALRKHPDAPGVDMQWVYYKTRKPYDATPVRFHLSAAHVEKRFSEIEVTVQLLASRIDGTRLLPGSALVRARRAGNARGDRPFEAPEGFDDIPDDLREAVEAMPYDASHCDAFGGCPYRGLCNLGPFSRLRSVMSQGVTVNLIDSLRAKMGAAANPEPAAVVDHGPEKGKDTFNSSWNQAPQTPAIPPPAAPVPPVVVPPNPAPTVAINPPEYQAPPTSDKVAEALGPAPESTAAPTVVPVATEAPEAPKPRRGRPPKASKEAPTEAPQAPAPAQETAHAHEGPPIRVLYIDCAPQGRPASTLEALLPHAHKTITEQTGKADYRFIDYGQGPGVLSQAIAGMLDALPPQGKQTDLVVSTCTPEGQACLAACVARAGVVVRGFR